MQSEIRDQGPGGLPPRNAANVRRELARNPSMIHKIKDLSPDQRLAIESLLGRSIREDEKIVTAHQFVDALEGAQQCLEAISSTHARDRSVSRFLKPDRARPYSFRYAARVLLWSSAS
jgi:hypothetical protein